MVVAVCMVTAVTAQTTVKKPAAKPAGKPGVTTAVFKSQNDSLSYSIGMSLASFYKQQGIDNINTTLLNRAINDIKTGKNIADRRTNDELRK